MPRSIRAEAMRTGFERARRTLEREDRAGRLRPVTLSADFTRPEERWATVVSCYGTVGLANIAWVLRPSNDRSTPLRIARDGQGNPMTTTTFLLSSEASSRANADPLMGEAVYAELRRAWGRNKDNLSAIFVMVRDPRPGHSDVIMSVRAFKLRVRVERRAELVALGSSALAAPQPALPAALPAPPLAANDTAQGTETAQVGAQVGERPDNAERHARTAELRALLVSAEQRERELRRDLQACMRLMSVV